MRRVVTLVLFGIGSSAAALAVVPEIDPASAGSAVALLAGTILILRGRRGK